MVRLKVEKANDRINTIMFQFQNGAIKSATRGAARLAFPSFNSKMVRLKDKGEPTWPARYTSFNSKMVRLKAHYPRPERAVAHVSIPKWCD